MKGHLVSSAFREIECNVHLVSTNNFITIFISHRPTYFMLVVLEVILAICGSPKLKYEIKHFINSAFLDFVFIFFDVQLQF